MSINPAALAALTAYAQGKASGLMLAQQVAQEYQTLASTAEGRSCARAIAQEIQRHISQTAAPRAVQEALFEKGQTPP